MSGGELAIVLAAVIVGSVVKAVTGMGLPLVVIPIAALFTDVESAVVIIALPNLLANVVLGARERSSFATTRDLPTLAVFSIIGATIGTLLFVNVPEEPLIVALVVAILGYILLFFARPEHRTGPEQSRRLAPGVGLLAGGFQGAIGISGPIVGSWIHSYRLDRGGYILSVTVLFLVSGLTQFAILVASGELDGRLVATLLACVPVLASIPVGTALRSRISGRGFDLATIGLLALSVAALVVRTFVTGS